MEERIVEALRELSLTSTEARAYVALLKNHPATGYELAARSQVPRSAIYNVLHRLQELGLINAIQQKPAKFVPLPPDRLFELLESRFSQNMDRLKSSLENFESETPDALTWTVRGYAPMLAQARTLIEGASKSIYASIWRREAIALQGALEKALSNQVDVVLFSFNRLPSELGRTYGYGISEKKLEAYWSHQVILIADRTRLLVGGAEETDANRSVVTEESTLIEMAVSNLVLDVTLYGQRMKQDVAEVVQRFTPPLAPVEELLAEREE